MKCHNCGVIVTEQKVRGKYKKYEVRYICNNSECPIIYWRKDKERRGDRHSRDILTPIFKSTYNGTPIREVNKT